MSDLVNTNIEWPVKSGARRLDVEVFFRGLGGCRDTILTLVKLREAGFHIFQYTMLDGIDMGDDTGPGPRMCSGEADLGITTFFMPDQTDFIQRIYKTLFDMTENKQIDPDHWLNDYDQYSKIQVRHRVDCGEFSEWKDSVVEEAA